MNGFAVRKELLGSVVGESVHSAQSHILRSH
jgi:hypothetical protein